MPVIGEAEVEIKGKTDNFTKSSEAGIDSGMNDLAKKAAATFATVFAGAKLLDFGKNAFAEAEEAIKVAAQTEAVIKSTGGAAGITAGQIDKLTASIEAKVGIDGETIKKGENLLLTFTNLRNEAGAGNDIFNQATQIMVDMGAAMGGDASSSAIQLGKALNDPEKGITALTRVGVTFTDQQKEQIKAMQAAGDMAGAQKVILAELQKEFGGSAAAQATAADKAKVAWGNFQEMIGMKLMPAVVAFSEFATTTLVPALSRLVDGISKVVSVGIEWGKWLNEHRPVLAAFAVVLGAVATGWLTMTIIQTVTSMVTAAQTAWATLNTIMSANPAVLIVAALVALAAALYLAYENVGWFRDAVDTAFAFLRDTVLPIVTNIGETVAAVFVGIYTAVSDAVTRTQEIILSIWRAIDSTVIPIIRGMYENIVTIWNTMRDVIDGVIKVIQGIIQTVMALIKGDWDGVWEGIKTTLSGVWTAIQGVVEGALTLFKDTIKMAIDAALGFFSEMPGRILGALESFGSLLLQKGLDLIAGLVSGIGQAAIGLFQWWIDLHLRVLEAIGDLASTLADKGRDLIQGLWTGAANLWSTVWDWVAGIPGRVLDAIGDLGSTLFNAGHDLFMGLWDGIKAAWNWMADRLTVTIGGGSFLGVDLPKATVHFIPHLAKGMLGFPGGYALVGENGPEVVKLPRGTDVYPNGTIPAGLGGGVAVTSPVQVTVQGNVYGVDDMRRVIDSAIDERDRQLAIALRAGVRAA